MNSFFFNVYTRDPIKRGVDLKHMSDIAVVVSETVTRFRPVQDLLLQFGLFAIHMPAIFVNSTGECKGMVTDSQCEMHGA